jgi:predicted RNA-binding protein with RPS1 domain
LHDFSIDSRKGSRFDRRMSRLLLILPFLTALSFAADVAIKPGVRSPISFKVSPQVSDNAQIKMRMHAMETPPPYDVSLEKFDIIVPKKYKKGDVIKAVVIDIDVDKERIALGVKQVSGDPMESLGPIKKGDIVTVTVTEVTDSGIEVAVGDLKSFIRKNELSRDRAEQRPERYSVGDKIDARVTNVDKAARKVAMSIKAREIAEEKEAVAQYGSSDSGASLGDILGAALRKKAEKSEE